MKFLAAILNAMVDLRYVFSLPLPVVRAFFLSGELLLLAAKPLLFVFKPTRIPNLLACGKRDKAFNAQVHPNKLKVAALSIGSREKIGFLCADEADVILSCGIFHRPHQLLGSDGSSRDHRMFISPGIFERRSFCFPFSSR